MSLLLNIFPFNFLQPTDQIIKNSGLVIHHFLKCGSEVLCCPLNLIMVLDPKIPLVIDLHNHNLINEFLNQIDQRRSN